MSKAFTSEETEVEGPLLRAPPVLEPGQTRWITRAGHTALLRERDRLLAERAKVLGDRTDAGRAKQAQLEGRARLIDATLAVLTVAPERPEDSSRVSIGAFVELSEEGAPARSWQLVGPDEADAKAGKLSIESPLARALIGRRAGEVVEVERPRGTVELEIVSLRWEDKEP
ncbi:MAG: GreA/GreB family elongation factor [Deltaproteobacteria bacterium]|nr:GreA/GreB family elongation factor [Deltaproteobacteria bacterium]